MLFSLSSRVKNFGGKVRSAVNAGFLLTNKRNRRHGSAGEFITSTIAGTAMLLISLGVGVANAHATESTLALSIDESVISIDIAPITASGNFAKSDSSTITASTNNTTGYTLSIASSPITGTSYNQLVNSSDSM